MSFAVSMGYTSSSTFTASRCYVLMRSIRLLLVFFGVRTERPRGLAQAGNAVLRCTVDVVVPPPMRADDWELHDVLLHRSPLLIGALLPLALLRDARIGNHWPARPPEVCLVQWQHRPVCELLRHQCPHLPPPIERTRAPGLDECAKFAQRVWPSVSTCASWPPLDVFSFCSYALLLTALNIQPSPIVAGRHSSPRLCCSTRAPRCWLHWATTGAEVEWSAENMMGAVKLARFMVSRSKYGEGRGWNGRRRPHALNYSRLRARLLPH